MRWLLVLVLAVAPTIATCETWTPYISTTIGFRINAPGQISESHGRLSNHGFDVRIDMLSGFGKDIQGVVTLCTLPESESKAGLDRFVASLQQGIVKSVGGHVVSGELRQVGHVLGWYLKIDVDDKQFGLWIAVKQNKVYAITFIASKSEYSYVEAVFLESFQLLDTK